MTLPGALRPGGLICCVILAAVLVSGMSQSAGALSCAGVSLTVEATAVSERGESVGFAVIAVTDVAPWYRGELPAPGDVLSVEMGERGPRFIHTGTDYLVPLYVMSISDQGDFWAGLGGTCTSPVRLADGSSIDTGYLTRDGFEFWLIPVAGAVLAVPGLLVFKLVERRHLRRVARDAAAAIVEREKLGR